MARDDLQDLHDEIHDRLLAALGEHSYGWLEEKSGVPKSTISTQVQRKRFTLETVWAYSRALRVDVGWMVRGEAVQISQEEAAASFLAIQRMVHGASFMPGVAREYARDRRIAEGLGERVLPAVSRASQGQEPDPEDPSASRPEASPLSEPKRPR